VDFVADAEDACVVVLAAADCREREEEVARR
jgi:hypothetical protein